MSLAAPMWLWLTVPWAVLAAWMLFSRRLGTPARVPFVALWRGTVEAPKQTRSLTPPPVAIVAILAAIVLTIVGAARPIVGRGGTQIVTVVLDRGMTMSGMARRLEVLASARRLVPKDATIKLVTMPQANVADFDAAVNLPATCVDTAAGLQQAVSQALATSLGPVIVLSDQSVRDDARIIRIPPTQPVNNAAISRFALRSSPTTQAMVTVRNDSQLSTAQLVVENARQTINLPPAGQERNYFIDLPALGATTTAKLEIADDSDADNAAYLARQRAWPRIEVRGDVAPQVRLVIEAYRRAREPSEGSASIGVVRSAELLQESEVGVIAPPASADIDAALTFRSHPITANLDASRWKGLRLGTPATGDGWTPVILCGDAPILSVRETPVRKVWVAFASADLAKTTDFVVLWTNILDWVNNAPAESFTAGEVGKLAPEWKPQSGRDLWPGIYRRSDGAVMAANAPAVRPTSAAPSPQRDQFCRDRLAALLAEQPRGHELSSLLFIAAGAAAFLAAAAWPRAILTPISPARTVS